VRGSRPAAGILHPGAASAEAALSATRTRKVLHVSDRHAFIHKLIAPLRVAPDRRVHLGEGWDPSDTFGTLTKDAAELRLAEGVELLSDYQQRLAAQNTFAVLMIIQGIDAAGKDGTIKHVMSGVNPQGVDVHAFKVPSAEDLSHDYLWRYQRQLPARGRIGIFNRSHYEEVTVVRVHPTLLAHEQLPAAQPENRFWERRYREINDWERYLTDNGIRVVKVLLHISRDEQRQRLLTRIDDASRNWKFSAEDLAEREHWGAYQKAFSEMLSNTSTPWAPWYIVPANHKWFARAATASILVNALDEIDPQFPTIDAATRAVMSDARRELADGG
jgi:PPK2 family polyphosphate:nucleotide phosphotransferase